ncbi:zona pellucida sperm-binding protein 4-like isoform X2 [Dendrobates tinctorius]|uniref:zona pellucida sperm-binding protein 4-like isoform X2 n=1 Tax=Dendrobates tinctorius TaxID=92724 RepID=UPI003CC9944B
MAGQWWVVCVVALLGALFAVAQHNVYYEEQSLLCEEDSMEYSLQLLDTNVPTRLSIYDVDGNEAPLVTDESCGIWVTPGNDSYLIIFTYFYGCYVQMLDNAYTMTIFLEVNTTGEWEVYQKEDLKCPVSQLSTLGGDSPSPSECSDVPRENRLTCVSLPVSQNNCLQNGCCYDQADTRTPCYFGNKVTAQCTRDGMLSVAVSKDVTQPSLILTSIKFPRARGPECEPVAQNNAFLLYSFPLSACGTTQTVDGSTVHYENDMAADIDVQTWKGSSITRDSTFRLHIHCGFSASDSLPVKVEVFTLPPPSPAASQGPLYLEMRIALNDQYRQYYGDDDYPIPKVLRDSIYVEVRIVNRRDPGVVLMLDQCWATDTINPQELPQWPILVDGCPFDGDNYMTQPLTIQDASLEFPLHYQRFNVKTFAFYSAGQASLGGLVYFHCSASACVPSSQNQCAARCPSRRRRAAADREPVTVVSADGPIELYMDDTYQDTNEQLIEEYQEKGHHQELNWVLAVMAGSVLGIVVFSIWLKKQRVDTIKDKI